jgi:acyl-CoA thioester hydrolase
MGHVNNAVYLSYFEYTRVYYFEKLLGQNWDWKNNGTLLIKNEVEYLKPILLSDKPQIEMFIGKIGNKSFTFHYETRVNGILYTKALSIMVSYNQFDKKTIQIPDEMKNSFSLLKPYAH